MIYLGMVFFVICTIGILHVWLSRRNNPYFGLIIPSLNILISTLLSMMTTDFFVAFYVLFTTSVPLIIWMGIYKICRIYVNKKINVQINKMRIKDL
ncbi:MAG: hypothetical protein ABF289_20395 [Clostridiales bacterium]